MPPPPPCRDEGRQRRGRGARTRGRRRRRGRWRRWMWIDPPCRGRCRPPSLPRGRRGSRGPGGGETTAGSGGNNSVVVAIADPVVGGAKDADPTHPEEGKKSRKRKRKTRRDDPPDAAVGGSADEPPLEKSKGRAKCDKRFWCEFFRVSRKSLAVLLMFRVIYIAASIISDGKKIHPNVRPPQSGCSGASSITRKRTADRSKY
jgi:hypothetical protein